MKNDKTDFQKQKEARARRRVLEYLPNIQALQRADYLTMEAFGVAFFLSYDSIRKDHRIPFVYLNGRKYVDMRKFWKLNQNNTALKIERPPKEEVLPDKQASLLINEHLGKD